MRWAEMQLGLIEGILHLVRKYTRRKTGYKFLNPKQVGMVQDVVVDEQVISKEVQLGPTTNCQPHTQWSQMHAHPVFEMLEETTDDSGEVDNVCRFVFFKNLACLRRVSVGVKRQVRALSGRETLYLRSPSAERRKIHVSPGFFPYLEPSSDDSITCRMACPTRPEPPVTRTTVDIEARID
jgi:hypothetical protein